MFCSWLKGHLQEARQKVAQWLLEGVHLQNVSFGENSIEMSPAGSDVLRWSPGGGPAPDQFDLSIGAGGAPTFHDGTSVRTAAHTDEILPPEDENNTLAVQVFS